MKKFVEIDRKIAEAEEELAGLNSRRSTLLEQIENLKRQKESTLAGRFQTITKTLFSSVTNQSSSEDKVALFMSLFRGRQDVYPKRFESKRTGRSGYQPACKNEWIRGRCPKPQIKCGNCQHREFLPLTEDVIRNHLTGCDPHDKSQRDFTIGVYPLLPDKTCWFIATDFDKATWMADASAFLATCESFGIPAVLERSRSGNGGHIWIFFSEPIPAVLARQLASFMLTETMERRPEIGLDSYDRFFPSQDTIPVGGFGNLIALPLQKKPRESSNSVFLDDKLNPYPDQWAFLSTVRRINKEEVGNLVGEALRRGQVMGVRMVVTEEDQDDPWTAPPSRRTKEPPLIGPMPENLELVSWKSDLCVKRKSPPGTTESFDSISGFSKSRVLQSPGHAFPNL